MARVPKPLPCPFCGQRPPSIGIGPRVMCQNFAGCWVLPLVVADTLPEAIERWNRRA